MMKNVEPEKKMTIGCLGMAALFFVLLGLYLQNKEQHSKQEEARPVITAPAPLRKSAPASQVPANQKKKVAIYAFTLTDDGDHEDDYDDYDPYDDPDFDDLFPGEVHEPFFIGNEGDPELYDEPLGAQ